jgi:hypothetical protein
MESPNRFFKKDLEKVLNAKNEKGDIAVILLPKSDYNNAFSTFSAKKLYGEIVKNYRTFAFEVNRDEQILERVREVGRLGQISFLMICGHGEKNSIELDYSSELLECHMRLSSNDPFSTKKLYDAQIKYDDTRLDVLDVKGGEVDELSAYLKRDAIVLLSSCSVGEGGYYNDNLASNLSHNLRIRKDCKIIASKSVCSMDQIRIFFENGKIKDAIIRDENNTLRLHNSVAQVQR